MGTITNLTPTVDMYGIFFDFVYRRNDRLVIETRELTQDKRQLQKILFLLPSVRIVKPIEGGWEVYDYQNNLKGTELEAEGS